jgi:hypothetical protein
MLHVFGLFGVGVGVGFGSGVSVVVGIGVAVAAEVEEGAGTGVGDGVAAIAGCTPPKHRAATAKTAKTFLLAPLI